MPRSHLGRIPLAGADDPLIGQLAGSYRIDAMLGAGGMGKVYRAQHQELGRQAAVKVLALGLTGDADLVRRFKVEAQAVGRLAHPNIVEVLDFGILADGRPYYAMEYLRGESLAQYLGRVGRVSPDVMVGILDPVLAALEAAHAAGVIHRDLKPENVFLVAREAGYVPKLLDFGVAKLIDPGVGPHTVTGSLLGTPAYMSPEQAAGQNSKIGAPSDLYSVGVMAYEMLTGRPPFQAAHLGELIHKHLSERPAPLRQLRPDAPEDLEQILMMALAKDPAERPQSAHAMRRALRSIASPQPITVVEFGTPAPRALQGTPPTRIAQGSGEPVRVASAAAAPPEPAKAPGHTTQRTRSSVGPAMAVVAALLAAAAVAVVLVKQAGRSGVPAAAHSGADAGFVLAAAAIADAAVVQVLPVAAPPDAAPLALAAPDAGVRGKPRGTPTSKRAGEPPGVPDPAPPPPGEPPSDASAALVKEAKEAAMHGNYDLAFEKSAAAVAADARNQEAIFLAGHASCMRGNEKDAKKYYALLDDSRMKSALDDVCTRWKQIYLTPTSKDSPADRSGRAMALYPKAIDLLVSDPKEALRLGEEIIALQPSFEGGYIVSAGAACRLGQLDKVKTYLKKLRPAMYDVVRLSCEAAKVPFPDPRADAGP